MSNITGTHKLRTIAPYMNKRPLIGVTSHEGDSAYRAELDIFTGHVISRLEQAGAAPVLVPLKLQDETLRAIFAHLDGMMFTGGEDIHPERYNDAASAKLDAISLERDRTELMLANWAMRDAKPHFGICRGSQIINVANGGTLYQDVETDQRGATRHAFFPNLPWDLLSHEIKIEEESRLAHIMGKPIIKINSLHHQAVRDVAKNLRAVAYSPDGVIEAIEAPNAPFALGVQWHPEVLKDNPDADALFAAFVEACRK